MTDELLPLDSPGRRNTWNPVTCGVLGGLVRAFERVPLGMPWRPPPDFLAWHAHAPRPRRHHALSDDIAAGWKAAGVDLAPGELTVHGRPHAAWFYLGTRASLRAQLKGTGPGDVFPFQGAENGMAGFGFTEGGYVAVGTAMLTESNSRAPDEPDVDGMPTARRVHAALGAAWFTETQDCGRAHVDEMRVSVERGQYTLHAQLLGDIPRVAKPLSKAAEFFPEFHDSEEATMCRKVSVPWCPADGDPRGFMNAFLRTVRLADGEEWWP